MALFGLKTKVEGIDFSDPAKKIEFINSKVGTTRFHSLLDGKAVGAQPFVNRAELGGRKLAIVGFTGVWEYEDAGWQGEAQMFQRCLDIAEASLRLHLGQIPGIQIQPLAETLANPAYLAVKEPGDLSKLLMGYFKYSSILKANRLMHVHPGVRATYGPWMEEMRALAQGLGVDYVLVCQVGITMKGKGVTRQKITPYMKIDIDMYSAHIAKCVWSAEIPKRKAAAVDQVLSSLSNVVKDYGLEVPAAVDVTKVSSFITELGGWKVYSANFGQVGLEIPFTFEKMADAIATKLRMDMGI
jgi:hypothetical protein